MKSLLLSVSFMMVVSAADAPYWVEPCTHPETGCRPGDVDLARWALHAWEQASEGRLHLVESDPEHARLRMVWALPTEGLYGETVPIVVDGQRGSQMNIRIEDGGTHDLLLRATIVYLTCLHESGHALGLGHTKSFADIMYSFQYGGDIPEYFYRYRRKLVVRDDIRKSSGLSADDRAHLIYALR